MSRYLATIRKYSWALLACIVIAAVIGYGIAKLQPQAFQATTIDVVASGAAGTNITVGVNPQVNVSQSNDEAIIYSAQIQGREFLQTVYDANPQIKARGYTVSDMLLDVVATSATATSPSTSSSSGTFSSGPLIFITVTTPTVGDTVLIANAVATGFVAYVTRQAQANLANQKTTLTNQLNALQKQSDTLANEIAGYPTSDPHAAILTADRNQVLGQIDKTQSQQAGLAPSVIGDVSVSQLVDSTEVTSSSKSTTIVAASAGVGLLLGILVMLLLIFLDNGLYNFDHIKEKLEMAYLGGIPRGHNGKAIIAKAAGPGGLRQLSDIRANLQLTGVFSAERRAPNGAVLLVTSPRAAEGKTTFAAALAATMANSGGSVVVVEGNLRQPATHLAFGAGAPGIGLSTLLRGNGQVNDLIMRTQIPNVGLVPGGAAMDDPSLVIEQKLPAILNQLRKRADLVIIDGPAMLAGADASLLATMVDGVALVIDARYAKIPVLRRVKELLKTLTHKRTGVVVNRLTGKKFNTQYFALAYPADDMAEHKPQVGSEPANGNGFASNPSSPMPQMPSMPMMMPMPAMQSSPRPMAPPLTPPNGMSQPNMPAGMGNGSNGAAAPPPPTVPLQMMVPPTPGSGGPTSYPNKLLPPKGQPGPQGRSASIDGLN